MRNLLLILLLLQNFFLQAQWYQIADNVDDFDFSSTDIGYYVQSVFISPSTGYDNNIFRTENGGFSWIQKSSFLGDQPISLIYSCWEDTCYLEISGNEYIFKSVDGAVSWMLYCSYGSYFTIKDISFISSKTAYMTIKHPPSLIRIDAEKSTVILESESIFYEYSAICFLNDSIGYCSTENNGIYTILKTEQPRTSWLETYSTAVPIHDIIMCTDSIGYVVGDSGLVLKTTNAGDEWHALTTNSKNNINSIDFIDDQTIFCVGDSGLVLNTDDGGDTWELETINKAENLIKIKSYEKSKLYVLSKNGILYKNSRPTGIIETEQNSNLFYPNPFHDFLYISDFKQDIIRIEITAVNGQRIINQSISGNSKIEFETSEWSTGFYIASITFENELYTFKLIKM